jgi:carbonic anhydrase/acetyltransferase-like protein (isoleucine patch superfamily)
MKTPNIHPSAFVAPGAVVRGEVHLAENSSVFYNAVLRGDRAPISIGEGTNIQDNCVVHVEYDLPVTVGKNVTVGHGAILHGCTVGDETLIGMGAIVLNGAQIGKSCLIGAGALVTQNAVIPDGCMAVGSPARVKRPLTPEEMDGLRQSAADYRQEAQACKALEETL